MALTSTDLRQFTGSETFTRNGMNRNLIYTEGIKYVAEEGGAFWLIDDIAIAIAFDPKLKGEEFQTWTLTVKNNKGELKADDGNGNVLFSNTYEFTDFPLAELKMYVVSAEDFGAGALMLMLPSEY